VGNGSPAAKWIAGLVLIGVITAATLPGRQTVPVINAGSNLLKGSLNTAIEG
jgi:hypothetical protein